MILLMHCLFVRMAGAAFTPRQDQPPPSVWPGSQRRRRSPSGCSGRLGGTGVPSEAPASPFHTCRWGAWQCEPWRCLSGAASRNGSTTSPPPARRQPDPCTTHLHLHRSHLTLTSPPATRSPHPLYIHSNARASADTFLVPARSPRKTRPSRRPPRAARPLDRPTSFMRTTTPRSPPAKALSMMSRLRCAQSQHECEPGGISPQVLVAKGTRVATAP